MLSRSRPLVCIVALFGVLGVVSWASADDDEKQPRKKRVRVVVAKEDGQAAAKGTARAIVVGTDDEAVPGKRVQIILRKDADDDEDGEGAEGDGAAGKRIRAIFVPDGKKADDKKKQIRVVVGGDDDKGDHPKQFRVVIGAGAKHWIGIYAVPVDEALKSHLKIEDRLIVRQVIPDGPAAKAGVEEHDILMTFGDRQLTNLDSLIKAVAENEAKRTKITLLRGGKKKTVDIQPAERPAGGGALGVEAGGAEDVRVLLGEILHDRAKQVGPLQLRFLGPGFVVEGERLKSLLGDQAKMPKNLRISVTREGDEPAHIVVEKDDQKWEVEGDDLDELPEDIRAHVKRALGKSQGIDFEFAPGDLRLKSLQQLRNRAGEALKNVHEFRQLIQQDDGIEQLRREVESLRREVEKLKGDKEPKSDSGADEA